MNRRSFLHTSAALLGGLTLGELLPAARAAQSTPVLTPDAANAVSAVPSAGHPLLLNFNENALGMSSAAQRAVIDALGSANRYPDAARDALIERLAAHYRVKPGQISLGSGSSQTIQAAVQMVATRASLAGKKLQLVVPDPTFNYAELYAAPLGATITKVPLDTQLRFPLDQLRQRSEQFDGLSLVYLCNPNNPTATLTDTGALRDWITQAPANVFFIIDEAYAELVTDKSFRSALELVAAGQPNLVVTRTFSKLYALAGLRVGYGIGVTPVIEELGKFVSQDNTNAAGAAAALASLNDTAFVARSLAAINQSRTIVARAFDSLDIRYLPSEANFIFHQVKGDMATYRQRMADSHIMVGREFPPANGWNRLTLGTPQEMAQFVVVLKKFRQQGWI